MLEQCTTAPVPVPVLVTRTRTRAHIIGFYVIFLCSTSIIIILYGDYLIKRFKIESKFPRLAGFIHTSPMRRRKVKNFSVAMNFFWIFFVIVYLGFLDVGILFHYF